MAFNGHIQGLTRRPVLDHSTTPSTYAALVPTDTNPWEEELWNGGHARYLIVVDAMGVSVVVIFALVVHLLAAAMRG